MTGVDISERFITSLREQIAADNLTFDAVLGDIFSVQFDTKFSGAICMGNSFGYFSADKMRVFIGKVAASLEKDATFIINSGMLAESMLTDFSEDDSYMSGD